MLASSPICSRFSLTSSPRILPSRAPCCRTVNPNKVLMTLTRKQNPNTDQWSRENCALFLQSSAHYGGGKSNSRFFHETHAASSSSTSCVGSENYIEEPATHTKFPKSIDVPGCSSSLFILGTGYREKVFAIIGVKVYAAALYVKPSIFNELTSLKGRSEIDIQGDPALFPLIYQSPLEKSLQIVLVRDVDGKAFWDALDEAVSPRIKAPNATDESALSTFRGIFQGRPLKKGTSIFLTWLEPSRLLLSIASSGQSVGVDATIKSLNMTKALYDVFFGDAPVSPSLKASVSRGLASAS
ncbi:Fatty-acid-binding protein 3, chloroplastic-like protein [Drosera capensis]